MEQVQADIETLKIQMATQMTQFMEVITTMNPGQEELRALIEKPRITRPRPQYKNQLNYAPRQDHYAPRPARPKRRFDPVPMTYSQLLQHLLKLQLISLRDMPPPPERLPTSYDINSRCEYHSGGVGHDTERCFALKNKVHDLIDSKVIDFTSTNGPNVVKNPMPIHNDPQPMIWE